MGHKKCTFAILKALAQHLGAYVCSTPPFQPEQRVEERVEKRVVGTVHLKNSSGIQRVSDPPIIPLENNPTSTWVLQKNILHLHYAQNKTKHTKETTQNNMGKRNSPYLVSCDTMAIEQACTLQQSHHQPGSHKSPSSG